MNAPTFESIQQLIHELTVLAKALSMRIPEGKPTDDFYNVIVNVESEEGDWPTFNHKFDLLFGIDCIDLSGHLKHLCHGEFGMDAVIAYLQGLPL